MFVLSRALFLYGHNPTGLAPDVVAELVQLGNHRIEASLANLFLARDDCLLCDYNHDRKRAVANAARDV